MGIELASALHKLFADLFHMQKMDTLLANKATLDALEAGTDPHVIEDGWRIGIEQFKIRRKPFELYTPVEVKAK